ncbi:hypothetical protein [Brevibacillus daliensis]|uniref:hypothetical protein n=1 Tax=Brevibacillus daliensis TaxID=2892995 RepID=UPI001E555494|nr:hypothetical protein [Brevibacillus daliensis]
MLEFGGVTLELGSMLFQLACFAILLFIVIMIVRFLSNLSYQSHQKNRQFDQLQQQIQDQNRHLEEMNKQLEELKKNQER